MIRRVALALLVAVGVGPVAAACSGDDSGTAPTTTRATFAPPSDATPADFSGRGPYAVGEVDLQLDAGHRVAVFYPVDRSEVTPNAVAYSYSGADILDPAISAALPGALSGTVTPADTWRGLAASDEGPFPTVLHSHGFSGNLRFGNQHNVAVASWGFVVAAVDHPERGLAAILNSFLAGDGAAALPKVDEFLDSDQLLAALDLLTTTNGTADSPLAGAIDTERVAAEGHSAGGSASGTAAYDRRVDLWIGQAPVAPLEPGTDLTPFTTQQQLDTAALLAATKPPKVPSLIIAAEGDTVIPLDRVEAIFSWLRAPKRLAVIAGSGHAAFVDPCVPIRAAGGLSGFVRALGLDPAKVPLVALGENGCLPTDTDPQQVWRLIDHLTVAQLRQVFEIDQDVATASLDPAYLDETFPNLLRSITTK